MKTIRRFARNAALAWAPAVLLAATVPPLAGHSLDIPSKKWGISFGNSQRFSGIRFNFRDSAVQRVDGVNLTLWQPCKDDKEAVVNGLSLGTIPGGGRLRGIQLGILGVAAETELKGINLAGLGAGCGGDIAGLTVGLLGAGCGGSMTGVNLGGLGLGAGKDVRGITIGGLGAGTGGSMIGINIGGLGVGAGEDLVGLNVGGIGVGAGKNMAGINIGGIGAGAGDDMAGINVGGIGVGAGDRLIGLSVAGLGAGAPTVRGVTVGGLAVGGQDVAGILIAGGFTKIGEGGRLTGGAASPFNYVKGAQTGLAIGVVNYAWTVKGLQIGLVNIVRDNPRGLRVLPVFNTSFRGRFGAKTGTAAPGSPATGTDRP
jgi:hypothetical protein